MRKSQDARRPINRGLARDVPAWNFAPPIRIAITAAAFEAIAASLPFGSVGFESAPRASA
jgi:hypothetical protein